MNSIPKTGEKRGKMVSNSSTASSLEDLLDSLGRRNSVKPKDLPPALPARPTSRTRLPSTRRAALPEIGESELDSPDCNSKGSRWRNLGAKKVKQVKTGESMPASDEEVRESKLGEKASISQWHENEEYFLKKVEAHFILLMHACTAWLIYVLVCFVLYDVRGFPFEIELFLQDQKLELWLLIC